MKPIALVALIIFVHVSVVTAQEWLLMEARADIDRFEADVSQYVLDGYLPVGLDVSAGIGLSVLLVRTPDYQSTGWRIEEASSAADATAEFTQLIRAGYLLMDVSLDGDRVIGLFSLTPAIVTGWRIAPSQRSFVAATRLVADHASEGYTAWGISARGAELHHLFLRLNASDRLQTQLIGFDDDDDTFESAMTAVIADGWLPWGLARDDGQIIVRFIRPAR